MMWMYHSLFSHSPIEEILGCFQFGAITNKLLWIFIHRFLCDCIFILPKSTITGKYGNYMFSFLKNCQTVCNWISYTKFPSTWNAYSGFCVSLKSWHGTTDKTQTPNSGLLTNIEGPIKWLLVCVSVIDRHIIAGKIYSGEVETALHFRIYITFPIQEIIKIEVVNF